MTLIVFFSLTSLCTQYYIGYKMNDILQKIPDGDLKKLRDVFKQNWPYAAQSYMFVDHWIKWKKIKDVGIEFYCPNGDFSDGTFVAIVTEYTFNVFFFTLEKSCKRLTEALRKTKRIDWKKGAYICAIHEDNDEECMKVLRNIGHPIEYEIESTCWWLPKEKAKDFEISYPPEVYTSPLKPEHSAQINSIWMYAFPDSQYYLENLIRMNGGIGIFDKKTNKLCSWIMTNDFNAHGILQTVEEYKRKNFARELVKDLAKRRSNLGMDSISNIQRTNIPSQKLFQSVGFKKISNIRWVQFKRPIKNKL